MKVIAKDCVLEDGELEPQHDGILLEITNKSKDHLGPAVPQSLKALVEVFSDGWFIGKRSVGETSPYRSRGPRISRESANAL